MAITFVGSMAPVGANNGGNVTLTFTGASGLLTTTGAEATLQQNDLVVVVGANSSTSDFAMATSSSGWTNQAETYANGSTYDTNIAVWTKVMGATPDTSMVITGPGGASNATIGTAFALRGVDTSTPMDVSAILATGTATTRPDAGSITPTTAGAWVAVCGAGSAAAGAAYTNPGDLSTTTNHFRSLNHAETNDCAIGFGLKTDWSSGAFNPSQWTGGVSNAADSWAAVTLAIRPSLINGSVNKTLGSVISSSSADLVVKGSLSKTLGSLTVTSFIKPFTVGRVTKTLEGVTSNSGSKIKVTASVAKTLEGVVAGTGGSAVGGGSSPPVVLPPSTSVSLRRHELRGDLINAYKAYKIIARSKRGH